MSSILTSLPYYISYNDLLNDHKKSADWQKKWDIGEDEFDEIIGQVISRGEAAYTPPVPRSWENKMQQHNAKYARFAAISSTYQSKAESPPPSQIHRGKGLMPPRPVRETSSSSSSSLPLTRALPDPFDFGSGSGSGLSPPRRDRDRSRERPDTSSAADIQKATIDHVYKLGFEAGKIAASKEECPACALRRQRNREAARKQRAEKE